MTTTRREFLKLAVEGAAVLGLLRVVSLISTFASSTRGRIVRPPGAVEEAFFKLLCVRCGACLEACPTKAIILADLQEGFEVVDTPRIEATTGPCEFYRGRCEQTMRCGRLCPTGALQVVSKEEVKMGTVVFHVGMCLAYRGRECLVCHEMCPVHGAITKTADLKPEFHAERCVGCGVCVYHCPAEPKALTLQSTGARRVKWMG